MTGPDPAEFGWWLASRAAGVLALVCIAVSVGIGLAMAGKVSKRPKLAKALLDLHQQTALVGLVAIAVHGITLLGDKFFHPGLTGIAVPFVIDHARIYTGLGVTAGWLGAILGLSYYAKDRIGAQRWRKLHRATLLVYVLAVAHTLGSGTDAQEPWLRVLTLATAAPILFLFIVRILPPPAETDGFRKLRVTDVIPESATVTSFALEPHPTNPKPGQFLTVRINGQTRSYSLSGPNRISVKREPQGRVSSHLHTQIEPGDTLEASGPFGTFVLDETRSDPVYLVSVGIGATPVLAMLQRLVATTSKREVHWIHGARNGREHPFREEVRELVAQLANGHSHVRYSQPDERDERGRDYDEAGRLTPDLVPATTDADVYVCGPTDLARQFPNAKSETFTPAATPTVTFARSNVETDWDERFGSLLELAEAHDVAAQAGCRVGACHGCKTAVVRGRTTHEVGDGALICRAKPQGDVVLDL